MQIAIRFCLILLLAIGFWVDAVLIMNGAIDCSNLCTALPDTVCASQEQIRFSNLMAILAVGVFAGALRYLYVETRPARETARLGLNEI